MPTNSDKWFVGPLPVSKAFVGETQVYPVGGGGGDPLAPGTYWFLHLSSNMNEGFAWFEKDGEWWVGFSRYAYLLNEGQPTGSYILDQFSAYDQIFDYSSGTGTSTWGQTWLKDSSNYPIPLADTDPSQLYSGHDWGSDNALTRINNNYQKPRASCVFPGTIGGFYSYQFWGITASYYDKTQTNPKTGYLTIIHNTETPIAGAPTTRAQALTMMREENVEDAVVQQSLAWRKQNG